MTSGELYHGFGLACYRTVRTWFEQGRIIEEVESTRPLRCSQCKSRHVIGRGRFVRDFKAPPIGSKPVIIRYGVPRVECRRCGAVRQVRVEFASARRSYTKSFERFVLRMLQFATIKDVAQWLKVSWDTVKDIAKRRLVRRFAKPRLKGVRRIAIDEIAVRKGHRYLTLALDLDSGAVVFVGKGKGAQALDPFWRRVRRCKQCKIRSVATDMSAAYIEAVTTHQPQATLVFDRFHIMQLANKMLTSLRRALYRELSQQCARNVLKGVRWLLLKHPEKLDDAKNEKQRLQQALELNTPLATAYYMTDELRLFWQKPHKQQAERFLLDWIRRAEATGIRPLKKLAKTLASHRTGILAWYDDPISTGPLEGVNNKIKNLKRQAYGYRDTEFFKLRIMAIHETKYALVG